MRKSLASCRVSPGALAIVAAALANVAVVCAREPSPLPDAAPAAAGMDAARLAAIDAIVAEGIDRGEMPGAVVLVARGGVVVYLKAFGRRQVEPTVESMTVDTVFDLASLTKPVATATSVMKLVEDESISLDDAVAEHIPEFAANGKAGVTVRQLLTHQGGLIADNALRDYLDGPEAAWERIHRLTLRAEPETRFIYSDVGFIVLGELVERISGQSVHEFSQQQIFEPLGMTETGYLPDQELRRRAAPTEKRDGEWIRGSVHDPRAHHLGGVAGHAGLFSTAADLAIYAQMLLGEGQYEGIRVLNPDTVELMTAAHTLPAGGKRALGWDVRTGYSSNRGDLFSDRAFGHGGFTGTAMWIDPQFDLFYIFLSNRLHPDGKGSVNRLAGRIATVAAAAIRD
ncbi:MAG: class A beta-lactamase-related serine hydrolase [Planctomycetota bacterium]|nr:MAG: class A beta-lactamase-related serine hydrolase [Planctomycetota bacterium]REK21057.1 MAG: class A beta-lactamase-related serine hydrolase [Planctomycetota bacterium]REK38874.1 MAG: class A beta-lactamase-related serine hydrolase [Planctomycetota bacterium]